MKNCLKNFRYLLNLEDDGFEEVEQDFLFELLTLDVRIDLVELRFLFEQLVLDVRINLVELVKQVYLLQWFARTLEQEDYFQKVNLQIQNHSQN